MNTDILFCKCFYRCRLRVISDHESFAWRLMYTFPFSSNENSFLVNSGKYSWILHIFCWITSTGCIPISACFSGNYGLTWKLTWAILVYEAASNCLTSGYKQKENKKSIG